VVYGSPVASGGSAPGALGARVRCRRSVPGAPPSASCWPVGGAQARVLGWLGWGRAWLRCPAFVGGAHGPRTAFDGARVAGWVRVGWGERRSRRLRRSGALRCAVRVALVGAGRAAFGGRVAPWGRVVCSPLSSWCSGPSGGRALAALAGGPWVWVRCVARLSWRAGGACRRYGAVFLLLSVLGLTGARLSWPPAVARWLGFSLVGELRRAALAGRCGSRSPRGNLAGRVWLWSKKAGVARWLGFSLGGEL
jgi:hypothetical protein